jgi:hypothetical protein
MNYLFIFSFSSFISLAAIVFLFWRKSKEIKNSKELYERALALAQEPLFGDHPEKIQMASRAFLKKVFFNARVLRIAEIGIRRIRIIVLKIENFLFRLIDYLNGRRKISAQNGKPSPFLEELDKAKKSPKNKENPL